MAASPVFVGTPKRGMVQILPADTTTKKTLVTAGASGSKVSSLIAASDDSSARIVQVFITRSGTDYLLGSASVTALAGTDGAVASINVLNLIGGLPRDNDGQVYLLLESGDVLKAATTTTVTAAKTIHLHANYGDF